MRQPPNIHGRTYELPQLNQKVLVFEQKRYRGTKAARSVQLWLEITAVLKIDTERHWHFVQLYSSTEAINEFQDKVEFRVWIEELQTGEKEGKWRALTDEEVNAPLAYQKETTE